MRIIQKLILPAVAVLSLSGQAFSEDTSLRHELLDSGVVTALYSIDDHTTLIKASAGEDVLSTLGAICSGHKGMLAADEVFSNATVFSRPRV
jgi:hypothetical protein